MTYLELCKALRRECSVSGNGPAAVTGQTGEMARLVEWIKNADREIQQQWNDWNFLWASDSFNTISSQSLYDLTDETDMGGAPNIITDFNHLAKHDNTSDLAGELRIWVDGDPLFFIPWSEYQASSYTGTSKPYQFTIRPDGKWLLLPTPNAVYAINFEYYKTPTLLAANGDISAIPVLYHDTIVARAMMFYGEYESAQEVLQGGAERYTEGYTSLMDKELPQTDGQRFSSNNAIVITPE